MSLSSRGINSYKILLNIKIILSFDVQYDLFSNKCVFNRIILTKITIIIEVNMKCSMSLTISTNRVDRQYGTIVVSREK